MLFRSGRRGVRLSAAARELIERYPFPGNVRELMNAVERALIMAEGDELEPQDFQLSLAERGAAAVPAERRVDGPAKTLGEIEREAILAALSRNGGRREPTAQELGITRRTLFSKLKSYGYDD